MNIKQVILSNISRMPAWVNRVLLVFNRFPRLVYGQRCVAIANSSAFSVSQKNTLEKTLSSIVNHSIEHVPAYRNRYQGCLINSLSDFQSTIDFIDKDIVMSEWNEFIQDDLDLNDFTKGTTGGTSGKPLQLLMTNDRHIVELGAVHSFWKRFGYQYDCRAVLRNHRLDKGYLINPITKEFIFDGFDLSNDNFEIIYKTMKQYGIKFLQCYPSSGYEFSRFLKRKKYDVSFIEAFFVSSENVQDYHRAAAKELGINYFSLYGHSEKLVLAGSCPYSDYYHIVSDYGYVELVDEANQVISEEGKIGEIVGTTLNNPGFPLIRYKTGDHSEYINIDCKCGYKGYAFKTIYGRWNGDKVFNTDDSFVTTTALNLHNELYSVIDGLQYVQNKKGELTVNVIPGDGYNDDYRQKIQRHFQSKLNDSTVVTINSVDTLVRQKNGKFLLLLSDVA